MVAQPTCNRQAGGFDSPLGLQIVGASSWFVSTLVGMVKSTNWEGWVSGLSHQTVNLAPDGLRRFESYPLHHIEIEK